jgi:hypothetical protein
MTQDRGLGGLDILVVKTNTWVGGGPSTICSPPSKKKIAIHSSKPKQAS